MSAASASPPEIIEVEEKRVACDGGNAALGHPMIYLEMGDENHVACPYCGREFRLKAGATGGAGH
ncbi:MAG: zinc-finger domain-containing protein [Alphaproteobacteria bacterium]|nr:zinc-finger domain-containing protein [Alphaproteobacteria bacterium]